MRLQPAGIALAAAANSRYTMLWVQEACGPCASVVSTVVYPRSVELTATFFRLLDQHLLLKKRVSEVASMMGITANHLCMIVREVTGFSPGYHIRQRIVLEAKRQAICERASMKEISYALGFYSPAHFSKYFKDSTGMNFRHFRKTA